MCSKSKESLHAWSAPVQVQHGLLAATITATDELLGKAVSRVWSDPHARGSGAFSPSRPGLLPMPAPPRPPPASDSASAAAPGRDPKQGPDAQATDGEAEEVEQRLAADAAVSTAASELACNPNDPSRLSPQATPPAASTPFCVMQTSPAQQMPTTATALGPALNTDAHAAHSVAPASRSASPPARNHPPHARELGSQSSRVSTNDHPEAPVATQAPVGACLGPPSVPPPALGGAAPGLSSAAPPRKRGRGDGPAAALAPPHHAVTLPSMGMGHRRLPTIGMPPHPAALPPSEPPNRSDIPADARPVGADPMRMHAADPLGSRRAPLHAAEGGRVQAGAGGGNAGAGGAGCTIGGTPELSQLSKRKRAEGGRARRRSSVAMALPPGDLSEVLKGRLPSLPSPRRQPGHGSARRQPLQVPPAGLDALQADGEAPAAIGESRYGFLSYLLAVMSGNENGTRSRAAAVLLQDCVVLFCVFVDLLLLGLLHCCLTVVFLQSTVGRSSVERRWQLRAVAPQCRQREPVQ